ncbi:PhnD/SsuA/transferrin family substrate-binding protein [Aestuariibius sp. 2305UL40-4]|uniref:PhnD/SsuA/transferrin family substrate-binding protein n=1 Tax=Aestuariibius violaceus TaxID=3234132 RepID=UPI00345E4CC1
MSIRHLILAACILPLPALAQDVVLAVTDVEGLEQLQQEFGAVETALEASTGLEVDLFPVSSRTAAVEAMRAGQVNFVLTGPAEYVVMKEILDPQIVVAWQRPDYYAQIVTLADSEVGSAADLEGGTVSFGSVGSTSQHLGPAQALSDLGLSYGSDYDAQIIRRNVAVEALIRGDIDAVGMNRGHLEGVREAYPDVAFKVVARGPDLPNDILVAASDVDVEVFEAVRAAFLDDGEAIMRAVLEGEDNDKYEGGFFLGSIDDSDYDYVRAMYRTIGVDSFGAFVGD